MCDFSEFFDENWKVNAELVRAQFLEFRLTLSTEKTIRIYVEGQATGTGHVACTCKIMERITATEDASNWNLGYKGKIEVVWRDDQLASVKKRMSNWFPQLKQDLSEYKIAGAVVVFRHISDLTENIRIGITGGINAPKLTAAGLHVDNFLHLEPAWWGFDDCIEIGKNVIPLDGTNETNSTVFSQRAYVYEQPAVIDWRKWGLDYPGSVNVVHIAEQIFQLRGSGAKREFLILPSYIFNQNMTTRWLQILTVLVGSLQHLQDQMTANALPVVIVDVSEIDETASVRCGMKPMDFWSEVTRVLSGNLCEWDYKRLSMFAKEPEKRALENSAGTESRMAFYNLIGAHTRFEKCFPKVSEESSIAYVQKQLQAFLASQTGLVKKVLFLHLGRLPAPVFEHFLAEADLPSLFEGVNTANSAMLFGKPYFHRKLQGTRENPFYPSLVLAQSGGLSQAEVMNAAMREFYRLIYDWEATNPCIEIGGLLTDLFSDNPKGKALKAYFGLIGHTYSDPVNDKLTQGICMFKKMLDNPPKTDLPGKLSDNPSPLEQWYRELRERLTMGQEAPLLTALPEDAGKLLQSIMGEAVYRIVIVPQKLDWIAEEADGKGRRILLEAGTDSLIWENMAGKRVEVVFSAENDVVSVRSAVTLEFDREELSLPGIPWILLTHPGLYFELEDGGEQTVSGIVGSWGATGEQELARFLMYQPLNGGYQLLEAQLQGPYRNGEEFYALSGGRNPLSALPAALDLLGGAGLKRIQMQYDSGDSMLEGIMMCFVWEDVLTLGDVVDLQEICLMCTVTQPTRPENSYVSVRLTGTFAIGSGASPGLVRVSAELPGGMVQGNLCEGEIVLSDLWQQFISFLPNPLTGSEAVTQLDFCYDYDSAQIELAVGLDLEWKVAEGFVLQDVGLMLAYDGSEWTGSFQAGLFLFPQDSIRIEACCCYEGEGQGWMLGAQMTDGTLKIGRLITEFLGWELPAEYDYGLKNLRVTAYLQRNCYTFYGETDGFWAVPFLPETGIRDVKASVCVDREEGNTKADITGALDFFGVELTLSLNYGPERTCYGIQWKGLCARVEKQSSVWTAALSLAGQTLGGMVETFVQWVSGNAFALSSPWSVLNEIPLSVFSLIFDFPENKGESAKIYFEINIGPVDLGFARIESIALNYVTEGAGKGVKFALIGEFFWTGVEIMHLDDGSQMLQWDPSKPEDAPAPPGGGSKYFDLGLLAMGQHLKLRGAGDFLSVVEAVDALKVMAEPEEGRLPVGPEGPVAFCGNNDWLAAAEFGVLRVNDIKEKQPRYFLSISGIFNDPSLYGLHVKLDGEAAKVLRGLEFDIMYRQVSDTIGCYSSRIALPELMRRFEAGVFSVTMPSFYFEVYTNGDFLVDVGFPHNKDFSSSFALEAVVAPGIPVMGSAGFYFGRLSSETTELVPNASNGWFNPVVVFGFGASIGVGKSIHAGILKAGFSLTVFGIIEGVIAKWLPYAGQEETDPSQLQDSYYFSLKGCFGVTGNLFGTVDFAIIKASVNVLVRLEVDIEYASCQPIPITVMALVDVRLSLEINLWLFTIKIHLSFTLNVKETLVIDNHGETPWKGDGSRSREKGLRYQRAVWRLQNKADTYVPCFGNLKPGRVQVLHLMLAPAMSICGDGAKKPEEQRMCYIPLFFLRTKEPVYGKSSMEIAHKSAARRAKDGEDDFENLAIQTLLWLIAAGIGPMSEEEVKETIVSEAYLKGIAEYLSDPKRVMPLLPGDISGFLEGNFMLDISLPPDTAAGEQAAVVFPAVPELKLLTDGESESGYRFADYNEASVEYLSSLREYFSRLAVKVQEEEDGLLCHEESAVYSVAGYVFADYFAMLAGQMVRGLLDGLRSFLYLPRPAMTVQEILDDIRADSGTDYRAEELLDANGDRELRPGVTLYLGVGSYETAQGDTLREITGRYDITFEEFASDLRNLQVQDLYTLEDEPYISVPHLSAYRVGKLSEECVRGLTVQRTGAMMSRYQLHGLRLPTKGIVWNQKIQGRNRREGHPEEMGLFSLMGQEVMVPEEVQDQTFCFALENGTADWITFNGAGERRLTFILEGQNYQNLCRVKDYITTKHFNRIADRMERGAAFRLEPVSVSMGGFSSWTAEGEVILPHGQGDGKQLKIWGFPRELKAMAPSGGSAFQPYVYPVKSRFDEAEGACVETPVEHFGTGTLIAVQIRKASAPNSFEILGAGSGDAMLLERMAAQLEQEGQIGEIMLLYDPKRTGAYQSDSSFTLGMTQVNLSTVTRPDHGRTVHSSGVSGLLNGKMEFLKLLWEAAITRNGGFYLHYYNGLTKGSLPDVLFDEKGDGEVFILAVSPRTEEAYERIRPYGNVLITDVSVRQETMQLKVSSICAKHRVQEEDSLDSLAEDFCGDAGEIALDNRAVLLQAGIGVTVENALYQAGKASPGRKVEEISGWFGITEEELKEANPGRMDWPCELPLWTTIRLPTIHIVIQEGPCQTIGSIADYYGITPEQFAGCNRAVKGLFAQGSSPLTIWTGPFRRIAVQPAGTASLILECPVPAETIRPDKVRDQEEYAEIFLRRQFQMLSYSIAGNEDFCSSTEGIPVGPASADALSAGGISRSRLFSPGPSQPGESWKYDVELAYGQFVRGTAGTGAGGNMYEGLGRLLQVELNWQDVFGNRIINDLEEPAAGLPWNRCPQLTGYVDQLYGVSGWPYAGVSYWMEDNAVMRILFTFDGSHFDSSEEKKQAVENVLRTYRVIWMQLTDPNGVTVEVKSSLVPEVENLLSQEDVLKISSWVKKILDYLLSLLDAEPGEAPISPDELRLCRALKLEELNSRDLFELKVWLEIRRERSFTAPGMELSEEIWKADTEIPPDSGNTNQAGSVCGFAEQFFRSFHSGLGLHMEAAQGVNRLESGSDKSTLWAVRLGMGDSGGIRIYQDQAPVVIYAPRPLSTRLVSLHQVPVYDYCGDKGIDYSEPSHLLDFTGIDLDVWLKNALTALDDILSPLFTLAALVVDRQSGSTHLDSLLESKHKIAAKLKDLALPVFEDEVPEMFRLESIREAYFQEILSELKNVYEIQALIQVPMQVDTNLEEAAGPELFGNFLAKDGQNAEFSASKLRLAQTGTGRPAMLNTAVTGTGISARSHLLTEAAYDVRCLEHQIESVPGISGYNRSSWLHFVRMTEMENWPLRVRLEAMDIPLVLRQFPQVPSMWLQEGTAALLPYTRDIFERACLWDYSFTYQGEFCLQDTIYARVIFNCRENHAPKADRQGLAENLAQFVTVYPQLVPALAEVLPEIDKMEAGPEVLSKAQTVIRSLAEIAARLAASMEVLPMDALSAEEGAELRFTIRQKEDGGIFEMELRPERAWEGHDCPCVKIEGWETEQQEEKGVFRFRRESGEYLRAEEALKIHSRSVFLTNLHIAGYQSAKASLYLKRNEHLVEGRNTAGAFVYQTQETSFPASVLPRLVCSDKVSLADIGGTHAKRTMEDHLLALMDAVKGTESSARLRLEINYSCLANASIGARVRIPVLLIPGTGEENRLLAEAAARICSSRLEKSCREGQQGKLEFHVTMITTLTQQPVPILEFTDLYLDPVDIADC